EAALKRSIPVIPVLVGTAQMPVANDLPESLQELIFRNATEVQAGPLLQQHVERLMEGIESLVTPTPQPPAPQPTPAPSAPVKPSPIQPLQANARVPEAPKVQPEPEKRAVRPPPLPKVQLPPAPAPLRPAPVAALVIDERSMAVLKQIRELV